ncbi:hypothetical protein HK103_003060 [Boothiomyces macroporosus]|uniref:V-type proton ATPase subunit S1/VOA1 transmembrane domain-containing protein n=1 Tax=Boothiomyces macroporosus TaxID=261099 RepID=A0AAD5U8Y0_9FUNG|nr:hypothetical protein HK103_003060 [Boothiomyces macroporosus]
MKIVFLISLVLGFKDSVPVLKLSNNELKCSPETTVYEYKDLHASNLHYQLPLLKDVYESAPYKQYLPYSQYDCPEAKKVEISDQSFLEEVDLEETVIIVGKRSEMEKRETIVKRAAYSSPVTFQTYQFFSTGIFLGIFSTLLVLFFTLIGVRILTNLQTPTKFETVKK